MRRTLYIPEAAHAVWERSVRIASIRGETVSAVVVAKLRAYVEANKHLAEAVDRATKRGGKNGR